MIYLNLLNRIFGHKKPLTRAEIKALQSKNSSYADQLKAEDDELNSAAHDGWNESHVDFDKAMHALDKRMEGHLSVPEKQSEGSNMMLFFGVFSTVMIALIVFTYRGNQLNQIERNQSNEQNESITKTTDTSNKSTVQNQFVYERNREKIASYQPIEKSKQITTSQLKRQKIERSAKSVSSTDPATSESSKPVTVELAPKPIDELTNQNMRSLPYLEVGEIYLYNLKTVDYRKLRTEQPIQLLKEIPTGTPANETGNENNTLNVDEEMISEVQYIDYLEKSQQFFYQQSYKRALRRYLVILEHFPDDVNAHFYGGLCYHNLGQYNKAIKHFDASYALQIGNFREEATWFKAKALVQLNDKKTAKVLLKKIENESGFYSERATELLNSL